MILPYRWALEAADKSSRLAPQKSPSSVDVVLASDRLFLPYTAAALSTILFYYDDDRPIRIFLLVDEPLSNEDRACFMDLQRIHPFIFLDIPVDGKQYQGLRTTPGISVATYFRLKMHRLLPDDCLRVAYLDSDVVVRQSLGKFVDFDLGGAVLAGVEDSISQHYVEKLSQHPETKHVNAGVLLINVEALRQINFSDLAESFLSAKRYTLCLGDQEIITGILGLVTRYAPIKWNVHGSMFESGWILKAFEQGKNKMDVEECQVAVRDPAIIHYTYKRKPWIAPEHPRADEWFKAAAQTRYRHQLGA